MNYLHSDAIDGVRLLNEALDVCDCGLQATITLQSDIGGMLVLLDTESDTVFYQLHFEWENLQTLLDQLQRRYCSCFVSYAKHSR